MGRALSMLNSGGRDRDWDAEQRDRDRERSGSFITSPDRLNYGLGPDYGRELDHEFGHGHGLSTASSGAVSSATAASGAGAGGGFESAVRAGLLQQMEAENAVYDSLATQLHDAHAHGHLGLSGLPGGRFGLPSDVIAPFVRLRS